MLIQEYDNHHFIFSSSFVFLFGGGGGGIGENRRTAVCRRNENNPTAQHRASVRCGARAGDCTPRYSQAGDGLVACCDAEVPGCVAVRFSAEQDHCDCVFPRKVDAAMLAGHRAECAAAVEQWGRIADAAAEEARGLQNGGASASASPPAAGDDDDGGGGVAAAGKAADPDHSVKPAVSKPVAPRPEMVPVSIARLKHRAKLRERMPMPPAIGPVLVRAYAAWWGGESIVTPREGSVLGEGGEAIGGGTVFSRSSASCARLPSSRSFVRVFVVKVKTGSPRVPHPSHPLFRTFTSCPLPEPVSNRSDVDTTQMTGSALNRFFPCGERLVPCAWDSRAPRPHRGRAAAGGVPRGAGCAAAGAAQARG